MSTQSQTLETILRGLRPLFPPALFDGLGWESLLHLGAELPAEVARHMGFEFRLDDPTPAADFCLAIRRNQEVAKHFIEKGSSAKPGSSAAALAWLVSQMGDRDSSLARWIALAGLEYDLIDSLQAPEDRPEPGVFLSFRRPSEESDVRPIDLARAELAKTFAAAVGWDEDPGEQFQVERMFDALPSEKAGLMNAGALPGRTPRGIRLVVSIQASQIPGFLERLKWPGAISSVETIISQVGDVCPGYALSFDVFAGGVAPRLGLELFVREGGWMQTTRTNWQALIGRLREKGWCSADKAEALLAWPGRQMIYCNQQLFTAYQGINHCKITIQGDAMQAKAYTGMTYFLTPSSNK